MRMHAGRSTNNEDVGSSGANANRRESTQSRRLTQTTSPSLLFQVSKGNSRRNSSSRCALKLPRSKGGKVETFNATRSSTTLLTAARLGGAGSNSSNLSFMSSVSKQRSSTDGVNAKASKPSMRNFTSRARKRIERRTSAGIAADNRPLETAPAAAAKTSRFSKPSAPWAPSGMRVTRRAPFNRSSTLYVPPSAT
jgi:hypothetical protein